MEDFRRQFLLETVENIENLRRNMRTGEDVSGSQKRDIFRALHTVKGAAQTFGFTEASRLAHALENLLSGDENSRHFLSEGFGFLIESLTVENFTVPKNFTEKIRAVQPNISEIANSQADFPSEIPSEILSQLSGQEKNVLLTAFRRGQNITYLEIGFDTTDFADGLISFREILNESGEIIATFPSAKFSGEGKIGFQFLSSSSADAIETFRETGANILWSFTAEIYTNDAAGILRQAARHGREIAVKLGKRVEIKTQTGETKIAPDRLKLIFEVLVHLIRNAVDHAFETVGEIEIQLKIVGSTINLLVSDNGGGIDSELIKAGAIAKNLILKDEIMSERETLELIFLPEFSTKSVVTEISGRGIGLDAVKHLIEKNGGKITVESKRGQGATFEISIPR